MKSATLKFFSASAHLLLVLTSLLALKPQSVQADQNGPFAIETQSYEGRDSNNKKVHLIVRGPHPGRKQSFFGYLIREPGNGVGWQINVFLMDPKREINGYKLMPYQVLYEGEVGIRQGSGPSHFLTPSHSSKGVAFANFFKSCADKSFQRQAFDIASAGNPNAPAQVSSMTFDGRCSNTAILDLEPGRYRPVYGDSRQDEVSITALNEDLETSVNFHGVAGLPGIYKIRQKQMNLFSLNQITADGPGGISTGVYPQKIAFFISKEKFLFGDEEKLVLVNPNNNTDVTILKRK